MNLVPWRRKQPERAFPTLSLEEYLNYSGHMYPLGLNQTMPGKKQEPVGSDFRSLAETAYRRNGVVAACMFVRMLLFSEARFQFRRLSSGRPGDYFGTPALRLLEEPWPGGTTGDLLARAMQDVDLAGNWFCARRPGSRLERLRPDWVTIIAGSEREDAELWDIDVLPIGYAYQPGGPGSGRDPELFLREEVAHFAPLPDPQARFRGMSWITTVIREIMADGAATDHKLDFFENGATINHVIKLDTNDLAQFDAWVDKFRAGHEGRGVAYKTLFLNAAADLTPIGTDMQQMDFKVVQGAGETRIASAARVPPVIIGLSEGLQGSSLNQGNYQMARRMFVDMTMNPLWRNFAGSMSVLIPPPQGAELSHDPRDIPALREDGKDAAEILEIHARTAALLAKDGWDPDAAVAAILAGDLALLKGKHSGMLSVQLQPPGSANGSGNGKPALPAPAVGE